MDTKAIALGIITLGLSLTNAQDAISIELFDGNYFEVQVGTPIPGTSQQNVVMEIDITSGFNGFAVPDQALAYGHYDAYDPADSSTSDQISSDTISFDLLLDNEMVGFQANLYDDVFTFNNNQSEQESFYFYYLTANTSALPDDVVQGFMGITPKSVLSPTGIFNQLQARETGYVPFFGLYITNGTGNAVLGGVNSSLIDDLTTIQWYASLNQSQWQINVKQLSVKNDKYIFLKDPNSQMLNAKLSLVEDGIYLGVNAFNSFYYGILNNTNQAFQIEQDGEDVGNYIITYNGQCSSLYSLPWIYVEFPNSIVYMIPPEIYLEQRGDTLCAMKVIQAAPGFLESYNVDLILGRPFFENYYTIFNLNTTATSVGIVTATYTVRNGMDNGSIVFVGILSAILIGASIGGWKVYSEYKFKREVTKRKEEEMRRLMSPRSRRILGLDSASVSQH